MADNQTPERFGFMSAAGGHWRDPEQWTEPARRINFDTAGAVDVWISDGTTTDEAVLFIDGKRVLPDGYRVIYRSVPTRRQRIGALVRRVLRRKAGA